MNKEDIFFEAMKTRDHPFDGKFFVGVKTTGIYCRPICPAKPKRENVEFFSNHLLAEKAGYRPCLRCRPESAPLSPAWVGTSATVQRALKILPSGENLRFSEEVFANKFGVTARHLRRLFIQEVGKTPRQLILENKLNLARKLIVETAIPITDIAFSSGFNSIRRFNEAFKKRFKKAPREIRRGVLDLNEGITLLLPYRPPFDYEGLLKNYEMHRIGDLEWFENGKMFRVICMNNQIGFIEVSHEPLKSSLKLKINFSDMTAIYSIVAKVRVLFDLDSDPVLIANTLEKNSEIKKTLKKYEGIRLSSGWDAFETAVAVILGQLVSVERGRCLVRDLIRLTGTDVKIPIIERTIKLFPTPQQIMNANLTQLKTTNRRKETLKNFSRALIEGEIALEPTQDVNLFIKKVQTIKGIGPWTAQHMALKVLRDTDTFPESDLILARALKSYSKYTIESMSPWGGYVASLFWRANAVTLQKNKKDLGK